MSHWVTLYNTWLTKYKLANSSVSEYTNMKTEAETQAGLEKKWLEAWYTQRFWAHTMTKLTAGGNGRAKRFSEFATSVDAVDTKDTSVKGTQGK